MKDKDFLACKTFGVKAELDVIIDAFKKDYRFAWIWHASLVNTIYDTWINDKPNLSVVDKAIIRKKANEAAAEFMRAGFGISTDKLKAFQIDQLYLSAIEANNNASESHAHETRNRVDC